LKANRRKTFQTGGGKIRRKMKIGWAHHVGEGGKRVRV